MGGLWRNDDKTKGGKYLVVRRDGTIPVWPWFVLGARDPAAPYALRAYASACAGHDFDTVYVADIRKLGEQFEAYGKEHGHGDPTAPPEVKDNQAVASALATAGTGETRYRLIAETLWHLLEQVEQTATGASLFDNPYGPMKRVQTLARQRVELLMRSAGENATLIPVEGK